MSSVQKVFFTVADRFFYESLDRYEPDRQAHHAVVQSLLPSDWEIVRKSVWFHVVNNRRRLATQGWKIHVSGTLKTAEDTLRRVVPVLTAEGTTFKFALDRRILSMMTGKGWHRGGSGKFMTIYPDDEAHFVQLIERVHQATLGIEGPYILSDRRYKESRVVFYRYGGLSPVEGISATGDKVMLLAAPDGAAVPDQRQPFFVLPEWVKDPFGEPEDPSLDEPENTLKAGRYHVTSMIAASNSGGVYLATDSETGDTVLIKEARPHTNLTPSGEDAQTLLGKEYRFLEKLQHTGIAPRPIDFFKDWEHVYLVEEYLGAVPTLRFYAASPGRNVTLMTKASLDSTQAYWQDFKRIFSRIAEMLEVVHEHGVVFMDLSINNILVLAESGELKLIDFEAAFEPDRERPTFIFTPGFVSSRDIARSEYGYTSDYFAFGSLMLAYFMPINNMLSVDPKAYVRIFESICEDFGLPHDLVDVIQGLLDPEPTRRLKPSVAMTRLAGTVVDRPPCITTRNDLQEVCRDVVQRMTDSILGLASPDRHDRLFPADPKVFVTNPLSVGYGACGVAYVLHKVKGHVPDGVIAWILRQSRDVKTCPPGLYLGLAGVAWVLWDVGRHDEALELMRQNAAHPALEESPDMFYGLAGWGMTQLKFFAATGDRQYLDWAIRAGDTLARTAKEEDGRLHWPDAGGNVVYGFGHGASGISLFLLYLHLATQDEKYLELGRRALDFDLAAAEQNPEGASTWRMRRSPAAPWLPYFRHGTAGVGMAVVRYYWHLREPRYREALDLMLPDVDRKYAIMLGRFTGLTGIGEFLLDLEATEGYESAAREGLKKLVSGLLLFQVETEKGLCFPGYELFRLSCDLATGSAGIALFLHRYLNKHPQAFLVDELFGAGVSRSALDVQAAAS